MAKRKAFTETWIEMSDGYHARLRKTKAGISVAVFYLSTTSGGRPVFGVYQSESDALLAARSVIIGDNEPRQCNLADIKRHRKECPPATWVKPVLQKV